jgi:hypothetical protein
MDKIIIIMISRFFSLKQDQTWYNLKHVYFFSDVSLFSFVYYVYT